MCLNLLGVFLATWGANRIQLPIIDDIDQLPQPGLSLGLVCGVRVHEPPAAVQRLLCVRHTVGFEITTQERTFKQIRENVDFLEQC